MRKGWEIKMLGDVCDIYQPKTISISQMIPGGEYSVFGANGIIGRYNKFNHEEPELLITCRGATCGFVNISLPKSWINGNAMVVRSKVSGLDKKYLEFLFRGGIDISKTITGSAQPQITRQTLAPTEIPVPPIVEQQSIVSILDRAFATLDQAKENLQRNLQNAKELFQSELNSIFENKGKGWKEKNLKEISIEFGRGKSKHRPRGDASLLSGKYPLIQTGEISNSNHWITIYSQTYNEKGLAQSKLWSKGTICIAIVGANVAETGILNFDACFPDSVIGIVVNPKLANNEYVEYLLQSFKTHLKEKGKGTARDNINMGTFENLTFPFPLLETQNKIVQQLNILSAETKKLENVYQKKLEELKKAILKKAFSGELSSPERALFANDGHSPSKKKKASSIKSPERA